MCVHACVCVLVPRGILMYVAFQVILVTVETSQCGQCELCLS